jgi:hypothetical protein
MASAFTIAARLAISGALPGARHARAVPEPPQSTTGDDRQTLGGNDGRLLALLSADPAAALTVGALLERGVLAPAQTVYGLQLAGYQIDRVPHRTPDGTQATGYRIHPPRDP